MTEFEDNLYREELPNVCAALSNKARRCCTTETFNSFLPVIKWLPQYKPNFLIQDFVAGLTVGLTAIPQAIAYGAIAGLSPQYGLYSAFMGCFVYLVFGTCKDVTVGPTAIMALMVQMNVSGNANLAILSCFLSGCLILLLGLLNLGVLVQFISIPVTTGFTMAAAITIGSGQINSLFGISSPSNEFIASWSHFFTHLTETSRNDALLGVCTLVFLLLMRKVKDIPCSYKTLIKYISMSRNALAVVVGIVLCYCLSHDDWLPFRVSGKITPGIPPFRVPPFSTSDNGTTLSFGQMVSELGASIITIPLISVLESIAVGKAFSKGKIIDASQEMIALGLCNVLGSFVSSIPTTGSFTRTAINNASGVRTPLGGAVTGTLVLMTLAFLTNTFYYIPKASLAALIIAAMIFMVEYNRIAEIWRSKKMDLIPFSVTATFCLFWTLEYGMVCGILVNLIFILHKSARPKIVITTGKINGVELGIVEVQENLNYASAEFLKSKVLKFLSTQGNNVKLIIIKGEEINSIDSTVALNVLSLREDLRVLDCDVICWNWNMAPAGVICRLYHDSRGMFKFGKTLQEIVAEQMQSITITDGEMVTAQHLTHPSSK